MRLLRLQIVIVVLLIIAGVPPVVSAQFRDREERPDPQQVLQERLKELLVVTDEELAVLLPRIQKVVSLQADVEGSLNRRVAALVGRRGRGLSFGTDTGANVRQAEQSLSRVLESSATSDEIRTALDAVRAARAQAREQLNEARQELVMLLTTRQEAILFQLGILE